MVFFSRTKKINYFVMIVLTLMYLTPFLTVQAEMAEKQYKVLPEKKPVLLDKKQKKKQVKKVLGYLEYILVGKSNKKMRAKLDTGATTSSLGADIIKIVDDKKSGKEYVVFRVGEGKKSETFKSEIVRWVDIKRKLPGKPPIRRPVVMMDFCFGYQKVYGEVNLAYRRHFNYPVLVGRNILKNNALVDASQKFTTQPKCSLNE